MAAGTKATKVINASIPRTLIPLVVTRDDGIESSNRRQSPARAVTLSRALATCLIGPHHYTLHRPGDDHYLYTSD